MTRDVLKYLQPNAAIPIDMETTSLLVNALKKALADHAMSKVQRLGQEIEQEPVAHLWECIGRWSAYLVNNREQADCAPPSWLVDAVNNATTPPKETT